MSDTIQSTSYNPVDIQYSIKHRIHNFLALDNCGILKSSTSTAILASPGAGSTLFLRLLSGIDTCQLGSSILYNGQSSKELQRRGVNICFATSFLSEKDYLEPELTVLETIEFVSSLSQESIDNVSRVLSNLDLFEAKDTIAGSDAKRGLSGGQRRRLSLAQCLLTKSHLLFLDHPTTGLDTVTSFVVMKSIIEKTRQEHGILVTTLQQPSPDLLALFDEIILLEGGRELLHGPTNSLGSFLLTSGVEIIESDDLAERTSVLLNSHQQVELPLDIIPDSFIDRLNWLNIPLLQDLVYYFLYKKSLIPILSQARLTEGSVTPPSVLSLRRLLPFSQQVSILLNRQVKLILRNRPLLAARLVSTTIMAVILATMILGDTTEFQQLYGIVLFSAIFFAMSNNAEIPTMKQSRDVVYHDLDANLYTPFAYMTSVFLSLFPLSLLASIIYSSIVYWSCGFSPLFVLYLYFLLILLCLDQAIAAFLRFFSIAAKTSDVGGAFTTSFIGLWILVGGFYLVRSQIPSWLGWLVWLSPFWYTLSGVAISEFNSNQYLNNQGDYLEAFNVPDSIVLQGLAPVALFSLWFVSTLLTAIAFSLCRYNYEKGSKRYKEVENSTAQTNFENYPFSIDIAQTSLVFSNLSYSIIDRNAVEPTILLNRVSGFANPGRMLALMGSSGAGKTTLLDVLARRKTAGTIEGIVRFVPVDSEIAYGEQFDSHCGFSTVYESLVFSNLLRCKSKTITSKQRCEFLNDVLENLELNLLSDHLVNTLSRGELKRLTVAVEVASNSSVLCLDEPTTGLDAASASILVRCLHRLARAGRTIICTIHQPSQEVFYSFDDVLILQPGGNIAYFGPIGTQGASIFSHVESVTSRSRASTGNIISWAMSALNDAQRGGIDIPTLYIESEASARNSDIINQLLLTNSSSESSNRKGPVYSFPFQFILLLDRSFRNLLRNKELQFTRFGVAIFIAVLLGLLYGNVNYNSSFAGTQSAMGLLLGGLIFGSIIYLQSQLSSSFSLRQVFYRERTAQFYHSISFSFATLLATLPFVIITSFLFSTIFYFMAGLRPTASSWLFNSLAFCIAAIFYSSLGFAFCAISPTPQVAQVIGGLSISILGLSAGLFIPVNVMPKGWIGLMYACPPFHLLRCTINNQFYCEYEIESTNCPKISLLTNGQERELFQFEYVASYFNLKGFQGRYLFDDIGFASLGILFVSCVYVVANALVKFEKR